MNARSRRLAIRAEARKVGIAYLPERDRMEMQERNVKRTTLRGIYRIGEFIGQRPNSHTDVYAYKWVIVKRMPTGMSRPTTIKSPTARAYDKATNR